MVQAESRRYEPELLGAEKLLRCGAMRQPRSWCATMLRASAYARAGKDGQALLEGSFRLGCCLQVKGARP